jgi:hypothetical protein
MAQSRPTIVYKVTYDSERYQTLAPVDKTIDVDKAFLFDGSKKEGTWEPPEVYCPDPEKERGDFYMLHPSFFILRPRAQRLFKWYYFDAEWLPMEYGGEKLIALNFTSCITMLDKDNAVYEKDPETGEITAIHKYAFHIKRVSDSTVFKIPELDSRDIFCYEGFKDRKDEFRHRVISRDMKGLLFNPVWTGPDFSGKI